jgi:hypothetical protein
MRRLRAWRGRPSASSGGPGFPSGLTTGPCHLCGWTGTGERREIARSQVPGRTDRGLKERRGGTSKGVAVCLCFPAIREISRGRYQGAPFGVPPPSLNRERGPPTLPLTRRDLRAAMTLARKNKLREACRRGASRRLDCFVASLLAMTAKSSVAYPRRRAA